MRSNNNKKKKITAILLSSIVAVGLTACTGNTNTESESLSASSAQTEVSVVEILSYWNDCDAIDVLNDYVDAVTDEDSADYIPTEDRIAVFDLDGTLIGEQFPIYFEWMLYCHRVLEDDTYEATDEQIEIAGEILNVAVNKSIPEDMEEKEVEAFGEIFAGTTIDEFREYTSEFLETVQATRA